MRTHLGHVNEQLTRALATLTTVRAALDLRPPRPREREQMRRELAGVVGAVETVRIWLDAGAPNDVSE